MLCFVKPHYLHKGPSFELIKVPLGTSFCHINCTTWLCVISKLRIIESNLLSIHSIPLFVSLIKMLYQSQDRPLGITTHHWLSPGHRAINLAAPSNKFLIH